MTRLCDPLFYRFVAAYGNLEKRVQALMAGYCAPWCAVCPAVCCQPVYCREALYSPFLAWVRKAHAAQARWSPARGWLGSSGCRLVVGRPLVCYEFICSAIVSAYPAPEERVMLRDLAALLTRVGRRARSGQHLLEVSDFRCVNWTRLDKQLADAQKLIDQLSGASE